MGFSKSFEELIVWQKAHSFVLSVYEYTRGFPEDERWALTMQFRRAAISIAANIAEGYCKNSKKEKLRFFNISEGSLAECRYFLILSKDLGYGPPDSLLNFQSEIVRLLKAYMYKINHSPN